jgi:hypothetical protein
MRLTTSLNFVALHVSIMIDRPSLSTLEYLSPLGTNLGGSFVRKQKRILVMSVTELYSSAAIKFSR